MFFFCVCADRPLPMISDQDDFTPAAFPLVLADASIGEGAQRRSVVPISKNRPLQLSHSDWLQAG